MKLITLLLLIFTAFFAQDVNWKFQVRERSSFLELNDIGDMKHELRTRISALVKGDAGVSAFIQIQDARTLGALGSGGLANDVNLGIHQAYLSVEDFLTKDLTLLAGRMNVAYANQRIVGSVGWANTGRTFDGFVGRYKTSKGFFDVSHLLVNEAGRTAGGNDYGDVIFNGLHSHNKLSKDLQVDAYVYDLHTIGSKTDLYTAGVYAKGNMDNIFYEAQFATQFGKAGVNLAGDDINNAGMYLNAMAGYKVDKKTSVILNYELLSGDDGKDADKNKAFNPFAGTNHKFNGFMDKFYTPTAMGGNNGLQDIMVRVKYNNLMVDFHNFSNAESITGVDDAIGNEIDVTYMYKHSKNLKIKSGLSMFMFSDDYKNTSDTSDMFAYTMFIFNL